MGQEETIRTDAVNYRSPEWRSEQKETFRRVVLEMLEEVSHDTGDGNFRFKTFCEWYDPHIKKAYFVHGEIESDKVAIFNITWGPLIGTFTRTIIFVRSAYQDKGIGTKLNEVTEEIAKRLKVKELVIQAITDTSLGYWREKPGFEVIGHNATKRLS